MAYSYHSGELEVQARARVQEEAAELSKGISAFIKPAAKDFLQKQVLAIASSVDSTEQVWASLLTGDKGFIQVPTERSVQLKPALIYGDPILKNLQVNKSIGLIVIDFRTRRRLRLNGVAINQSKEGIYIHTQQVYFNCPKYIQARTILSQVSYVHEQTATRQIVKTSHTLTLKQREWIEKADTFFISTYYSQTGADASHRGGQPGFIRVLNQNKLLFPDYIGNNMFNTLGNISKNSSTGLLFIDFENGGILQLLGKSIIHWSDRDFGELSGVLRIIEYTIDTVVETTNACSFRWKLLEYSPFNPK